MQIQNMKNEDQISDSGKAASGKDQKPFRRALVLLCTPQPQFLLPGSAAVVLGSALGFGVSGNFDHVLALLALVSIVFLNAGSNMINDYYDHLSGNDWINKNTTTFSGGSRYIQKGIVSPVAMLAAGLICLAIGSCLGIAIVALTKSWFILILGLAGVLGGFFWTARPLQICYRFIGEPFIFLLFGLLPVYGAYYLQTRSIDILPLLPASLLGVLISMVLLINTFADSKADASVNKRTLVVRYGFEKSILVYRTFIVITYLIAAAMMLFSRELFWGGLFYFFTLPIAAAAFKFANVKNLSKRGYCLPNKITIFYHSFSSILMSAGFIYYGFTAACVN